MIGAKAPEFSDSHPLRIFPTLVWRAELANEASARVNASVLETLRKVGRPAALRSGEGWQSRQDLHRQESLAELVASIDAAVGELLGFLKIGHEGLAITACWANVLAPARGHRAHAHPNNYLSGVYYVKTPAGADTVNFHDPRAQTGVIRPPVTELTAENTDQVVIKVNDGTMLLFPAWLEHSVDANRSAEERVSLSFNFMFSSYFETMSKPLW